jgi:hypothetical protein
LRRKLIAALTIVPVLLGAAIPARGAVPPSSTGRTEASAPMTRERFARYIQLLNSGDARQADYYTPGVVLGADGGVRGRKAVLDASRKLRADYAIALEPNDVFISDANDGMAVVMTIRQVAKRDGVKLASQPQPIRRGDALVRRTVLFYGLSGGKISSIRAARNGSTVRRGVAAPAPSATSPAPPTAPLSNEPWMTREKFEDYARRFSAWDLSFTQYYEPDVVFGVPPAPKPLHGPQAIIDLYTPIRRNLDEHVTPGAVVIDNGRGMMVAEIQNRMTATRGDVQLPSAMLKQGDEREGTGVIFYSLRNGRIAAIGGGGQSVRFEPGRGR